MKQGSGWVAIWLVVCIASGAGGGLALGGESVGAGEQPPSATVKRQASVSGGTAESVGGSEPAKETDDSGRRTSAAQAGKSESSTPARVGWLEISGSLADAPPPVAWLSETHNQPTLQGILARLRRLAQDPQSRGLAIFLDEPQLTQSQVDQLAEAVEEVRRAGKKVLVFAQAYDLAGYLLACSADMILLQHGGHLELTGLGMEEIYLAGLLEKIGVQADLVQVGRFKGASEPLTRKRPSPAWSRNIESVLDDLYGQILERIGRGRGLDRAAAERALGEAWSLSDQELVARRLVDRLVRRDLREVTEDVFGADFEWDLWMQGRGRSAGAENPFALLQMLFRESRRPISRPSIALIRACGPITSGKSRVGGGWAGDGRTVAGGSVGLFSIGTVGSRTVGQALREAAENELIRGVVIRVDSPGGSALASEAIWQAIYQLRQGRSAQSREDDSSGSPEQPGEAKGKPVYVSIDSMAVSGGYYIASAADRIYASPSALVGSIGVMGGKLVLGELYEKLGIGVHRRSRGPMGDPFNSVEPFTYAQRLALEAALRRTYEQFLDRVRQGRGQRLAEEQLERVAQGRLFTARQVLEKGLVDHLGGLDCAIADLAEQVGLKEGQYDVVELPPPMSLPEYLDSLLGVSAGLVVEGPGLLTEAEQAGWERVAAWLGDGTWRQAAAVLWGLSLLEREPVLALWPVIWRIR